MLAVTSSIFAGALNAQPVQILSPPQRPASVRAWVHPPTKLWRLEGEDDESSEATRDVEEPVVDLSTEFAQAFARQQSMSAMEREIKRLASPDVPVWVVFEGASQPAVLPGSGTTDALHQEASRLHNLDPAQKLRFLLDNDELQLGVPIVESPLANSQDLQVRVMATEWPVRRGRLSTTAFSAGGVATSATKMSVVQRRAQRRKAVEADDFETDLRMDFQRYHN
jgi:hypothetical protein